MISLLREAVANVAGLEKPQINYMIKCGVLAPDVGGQRKRFSPHETRLAIVAAEMMRLGLSPVDIKKPLDWLRGCAAYPEEIEFPEGLNETNQFFLQDRVLMNADLLPDQHEVAKYIAMIGFLAESDPDEFPLVEYKHLAEKFESAVKKKKADDPEFNETVALAPYMEEALRLAKNEPTMSLDQSFEAENALKFELATKGRGRCYYQFGAIDGRWQTYFSGTINADFDLRSWSVINLTRLFAERPILG